MPESNIKYLAYIIAALSLTALLYLGNPAFALLAGMTISLTFNFPLSNQTSMLGKLALQAAIILLGFKLDIANLWEIGADYGSIVLIYVLLTLSVGLVLGRAIRTNPISNKLISSGTAICGGTTIACLSPVINAPADKTAAALALVFLLNAFALFTFPSIGEYFALTQSQFGIWCSLAIHDTSSVVATAAIYGEQALEMATTLKLGRTLCLIPLLLIFSMLEKRESDGLKIPGFIILFVLASLSGSLLDIPQAIVGAASTLSKALLVFALFCIGNEIRRSTFKQIEASAVAHALLLWMIVVPVTLAVVIYLT